MNINLNQCYNLNEYNLLIIFYCFIGLANGYSIRRARDASSESKEDEDLKEIIALAALLVPAVCSRSGTDHSDVFWVITII